MWSGNTLQGWGPQSLSQHVLLHQKVRRALALVRGDSRWRELTQQAASGGERGSSVPVLWEISAVTGVRVTLLPLLPERQGCETEVRPEGEPLLSENYEEINKHKLQVCAQLACSPWEDDSYVIPSSRQMTFGVSVCPQQYRLTEDWVPSLALFLTRCHNKRLSF